MTAGPAHDGAPAVEFLDLHDPAAGAPARIDFVECPPPPLSAEERRAVDRHWAAATAANPATFDGPLVAALGLDRSAPGRTALRWARMSYRHRALRELRPAAAVPGSVYVTVLQPTEEGLVLGRGAHTTAAPGRWSLPGGGAEPPVPGSPLELSLLRRAPVPGSPLELSLLRRHAAVELAEEVGLAVEESALRLWGLTRGTRFGSIGFHFLAPEVPAARVRRCHAALVTEERSRGRVPELDVLAFTGPAADARRSGPAASGPYADYLPRLLARYRAEPR
ncbi:NUDIX hydrolase [Streptomyces sp. NPDC046275]|uniref:NUDIX hydrolase n=1 Tax=Streptomyces sp. NPDC046275 TaxID=3157201 RepID=UPI0033D90DA0